MSERNRLAEEIDRQKLEADARFEDERKELETANELLRREKAGLQSTLLLAQEENNVSDLITSYGSCKR